MHKLFGLIDTQTISHLNIEVAPDRDFGVTLELSTPVRLDEDNGHRRCRSWENFHEWLNHALKKWASTHIPWENQDGFFQNPDPDRIKIFWCKNRWGGQAAFNVKCGGQFIHQYKIEVWIKSSDNRFLPDEGVEV